MTDGRDEQQAGRPYGPYGIGELAELGGVNRRTVRYYVQRGLLPAPTGTGRGKHYTQAHLDALIRVRDWQQDGVSLEEIKRRVDAAEGRALETAHAPGRSAAAQRTAAPPAATAWWRVRVGPDVELHVRGDQAEPGRLATLIEAVASALNATPDRGDASVASVASVEAPPKGDGARGHLPDRPEGGPGRDGEDKQ